MHNSIINTKDQSKIGRFNVLTLNQDSNTAHYLSDDQNYVCILPFEKSESGSVKSIYVLEYPNPASGSQVQTLVTDTVNPDLDKTPYDSVCRALIEEAGLNIDDLGLTEDHIYYLGDIQMNSPVSLNMHCYGVDITSKKVLEFTRNLSKDPFTKSSSAIKKVGFQQVVNGDYPDAAVLAGSFLLVSYFS